MPAASASSKKCRFCCKPSNHLHADNYIFTGIFNVARLSTRNNRSVQRVASNLAISWPHWARPLLPAVHYSAVRSPWCWLRWWLAGAVRGAITSAPIPAGPCWATADCFCWPPAPLCYLIFFPSPLLPSPCVSSANTAPLEELILVSSCSIGSNAPTNHHPSSFSWVFRMTSKCLASQRHIRTWICHPQVPSWKSSWCVFLRSPQLSAESKCTLHPDSVLI